MPAYPGRPREFTYQRRRELLEHVSQGATVEEAAQIVGLSLRTVQREARHNEHFDHDLQLALHAAPVDPHKMVLRAARTHWRAAAWLLERTDPDRFAKRPPNSCSYGTLQDISDWLIETALEATPPEHREGVYRRMRGVADKALDVLMPDQHDARRRLVGSLPERPMPLSDHEIAKSLSENRFPEGGQAQFAPKTAQIEPDPGGSRIGSKTLGVVDDRRVPAVGLPSAQAGSLSPDSPAGELGAERPTASPAADQFGRHWRPASVEAPTRAALLTGDTPVARGSGPSGTPTTAPDETIVADPVAFYRAQRPRKPPAGRPSECIADFGLQGSDRMDAAWRNALPDDEDADVDADADAAVGRQWRPARAEVGACLAPLTGDRSVARSSGQMDPRPSGAPTSAEQDQQPPARRDEPGAAPNRRPSLV
jgi:hypothetical protein